MNRIQTILLAAFITTIITCKSKNEASNSETVQVEKINILGNYVSEGYMKRAEGYDWVSVAITESQQDQINIMIRSRADQKKPTCTFDARAIKIERDTYKTRIKDKVVFFRFEGFHLTVETENAKDNGILSFYCSGGASIAGTYTKINEPLDENQIDKTSFLRILNLQDIGFNVSAIEKDGTNQLTVFTFGLPNEFNETFNIKEEVVINAEVEDLNVDGSPELIVFTRSNTSNLRGNVHAFSVNNKKSMSMVYFQPTEDNQDINEGYKGKDEFAIVETSLVQRFPIYENNKESGKMRQIQYSLEDGEASRKFKVKKVTEFEMP